MDLTCKMQNIKLLDKDIEENLQPWFGDEFLTKYQ